MNIPSFTAETILNRNGLSLNPACEDAGTGASEGANRQVIPQMMRTITVKNGFGALYLEYLCARLGGGMSSNADGSVSCNFEG
jgi:hypothetical protein